MGSQQILLVIVGIVAVGIAIALGFFLFSTNSSSANQHAIVNDLMNIGQYAYRYRLRPEPLGGGGRKYDNFVLPEKFRVNENADYTDYTVTSDQITFTAVSTQGYGTVTVTLDDDGELGNFSFTGEFE